MDQLYPPEEQALDEPWELPAVHETNAAHGSLPITLEVYKWTAVSGLREEYLSKRAARWMVKIHAGAPDIPPDELVWLANLYSNRERWSMVDRHPLLTGDLDHYLTFAPWRSESNRIVYGVALDTGDAPPMPDRYQAYLEAFLGDRESAAETAAVADHIDASLDPADPRMKIHTLGGAIEDIFNMRMRALVKRSDWDPLSYEQKDRTLKELARRELEAYQKALGDVLDEKAGRRTEDTS